MSGAVSFRLRVNEGEDVDGADVECIFLQS